MNKQLKDQTAHVLGAIGILAISTLPYGFIPAAFLIGFTREQGQRWIRDRENAWKFWNWGPQQYLDIAFWTLGGIIATVLL